jgi:NitT/TauT family transport system permease protein
MKRLINITPSRSASVALGLLPFLLLFIVYIISSDARLDINPNDKLLPSFAQMGDAIQRMAFEPSRRTGEYLFWQDTLSSLKRLGMGVGIAALLGLTIGMLTGAIPLATAGFSPLLTVISLVPALALLPVLKCFILPQKR